MYILGADSLQLFSDVLSAAPQLLSRNVSYSRKKGLPRADKESDILILPVSPTRIPTTITFMQKT